MVGIPGSGKTQFAKQFSETFNAPILEAEHVTSHARDGQAATKLIYAFVAELLKTKQSIVIDGIGSSRKDRMELNKLLRDHGYEPLLVWVQTDTDTAKQRVAKSGKTLNTSLDHAAAVFSAPHPTEKPLVISGKHTYATQARTVLKRLSGGARPTPSQHESQAPVIPAVRRPGTIRVQ